MLWQILVYLCEEYLQQLYINKTFLRKFKTKKKKKYSTFITYNEEKLHNLCSKDKMHLWSNKQRCSFF